MTLPAHSRIAPPGHDIPPGVLTGPGPDMVSRRRFPRCLTVLSLTVALLLGSWLTTQLPDRDTAAAAPGRWGRMWSSGPARSKSPTCVPPPK